MDVLTACTMDCPDACSLLVTVAGGRAVRLRGNPEHPFTAGFTCKKIKKHLERLRSPDRILHPMLRRGDKWQRISWDSALEMCAEKLSAARNNPHSIAHIRGAGAKGVVKESVSLFFDHIGATRTRGSLCDAAGILAYHYDFGSRRNHHLNDISNAAAIVNWGRGLSRTSIHTGVIVRKARKRGAKVLLISPCQEGDVAFRDHHIMIRPGTDRLLAAAMVRRLIKEDRVDLNTIERTRHWKAFKELILSNSEADLLSACDVTRDQADLLYTCYANRKPVATLVCGGLQRYPMGGENVRWINALALLGGHIGRKGGGSYFHLHSTGHFNLKWAKPRRRTKRRFLQLATLGSDLLTAENPKIKMLWVNGVNIVNQGPHSRKIISAFQKIPFKVVVDAFFNDTAARADLVLPSALMLEQEDVIGSYLHNGIQYVSQVVEPPGQARDDHWIVSEIGRRLDPPVLLPSAPQCMAAALDAPEISIALKDLQARGHYTVPIEEIAYADMKFDHPDGKARLPLQLHPASAAPEAFPLRLLSLAPKNTLQSQILPEDQQGLPSVWVSPDCSALKRINTKAPVYLVSPLGRLQVAVHLMADLHPGAVVYRRGDWMAMGGGVNQLIEEQATNIGGGVAFYHQWVSLQNSG